MTLKDFSTLKVGNKRSILEQQQKLFSLLGIESVINTDGTIITTINPILENTFKSLMFVTNNPAVSEVPMNLIGINAFLNGNLITVDGLFNVCRSMIDLSDKNATSTIHCPFLKTTIRDIVNNLQGYPVSGTLTFQLILDPAVKGRPPPPKVKAPVRYAPLPAGWRT